VALETELLRYFGFAEFRPGQRGLVEAALAGRDALGVMPTGGGKSLCFQLPAALCEGTAVVVSPLIALMKDQVDALRARGIAADAYNSSLGADERRRAVGALREGRTRLLYIAPERMQAEGFMGMLSQVPVSLLAIDEAHCISHWGHDFRPDYARLGELRRLLRGPEGRGVPVLALTATATRRVQDDIVSKLALGADCARVITGFRRPNLAFEVRPCASRAEKFRALRRLLAESLAGGGSAVIYCATRRNVELVAGELKRDGADYYHAGLDDEARARAQEGFITGRTRVLVATNAFGMGIDKPDVRLVAHFDIPGSVEAYYQEAGRAGRDGRAARCALLFNHADVATQEFFIRGREESAGAEAADALLKQLVRYAYGKICRQKMILEYFADPAARGLTGCGSCDVCTAGTLVLAAPDDRTAAAARAALEVVAKLGGRFGRARVAEVLKGSRTAGILSIGLERTPGYGALAASWTLAGIRELLGALEEAGYLAVTGLEYPIVGVTAKGRRALAGVEPIGLLAGAAERFAPAAAFGGGDGGTRHAAEAGAPLGAEGEGLLAALKAFRRDEAGTRGVPPYVVFHDRTIEAIARARPGSVGALEAVPGLGPAKIERYGERILALVRQAGV
jgi:ATP-dependent DNA helicase RecQ